MSDPKVCVTVDVDWTLDAAIDFVADALLERRVRATWFITIGKTISRWKRFSLGQAGEFACIRDVAARWAAEQASRRALHELA